MNGPQPVVITRAKISQNLTDPALSVQSWTNEK